MRSRVWSCGGAALGDPDRLARLAQGQPLDVHQDREDLLTLGEPRERRPERVLGLLAGGDVERVLAGGPVLERVDPLDELVVVGPDGDVERPDVGPGGVGLEGAQLLHGHPGGVGELLASGVPAVDRGEVVGRVAGDAQAAPDGARRPVVLAELVEDGAVDARPQELLERRALGRVVAVQRAQDRLQARGDEVLHVAPGRELADLAVGDPLDHRGVREHEAVPEGRVARGPPGVPQGEGRVLVGAGLGRDQGSRPASASAPPGRRGHASSAVSAARRTTPGALAVPARSVTVPMRAARRGGGRRASAAASARRGLGHDGARSRSPC